GVVQIHLCFVVYRPQHGDYCCYYRFGAEKKRTSPAHPKMLQKTYPSIDLSRYSALATIPGTPFALSGNIFVPHLFFEKFCYSFHTM
ncbi:MAG: hypothetical protein ACYCYR_14930, partial [Desulfobulbaceae bacterium]